MRSSVIRYDVTLFVTVCSRRQCIGAESVQPRVMSQPVKTLLNFYFYQTFGGIEANNGGIKCEIKLGCLRELEQCH